VEEAVFHFLKDRRQRERETGEGQEQNALKHKPPVTYFL
jgi:hypothetical protein